MDFPHLPRDKKSATLPPHFGSELPPHLSPWTPAAYALPTVLEKEKERKRVQEEAAEAMDQARLLFEQAAKRRKRRRRKKKPPRTSSHSSCGRARRRQRQWHARYAGFSVMMHFEMCSFWSTTGTRITAGMDQKDITYEYGALIVDSGSGMCRAGFTGYAPRALFFPLSSSPRSSTPWPMWTRGTVTPRSSSLRQAWLVFWLRCFRAVFSLIVGRPVLPGIMELLYRVVRCPFAQRQNLMVQTVQMYVFVQFFNKVCDLPVVGPHGLYSAGPRGASTGAVLG